MADQIAVSSVQVAKTPSVTHEPASVPVDAEKPDKSINIGNVSQETKTKEGEIKKEQDPTDPNKPFVAKVDGKEIHLTNEEAKIWVQKGMGAEKRFKEAHTLRTQAEQFIKALQENPESVLMNPKIMGQERFKKLAQDFLHKEIQREMMTPEQRELADLKEKLAQQEQERRDYETQQEAQRQAILTKHYNGKFEVEILDALQKSGLPNTPSTVKRAAFYKYEALKRGVDLSFSEIMPLIKSDYEYEHKELFGKINADDLIKFLGDENLKKIREFELNKVKNGIQTKQFNSPSIETQNIPLQTQKSKKLPKEEWQAMMEQRF